MKPLLINDLSPRDNFLYAVKQCIIIESEFLFYQINGAAMTNKEGMMTLFTDKAILPCAVLFIYLFFG